ncbi:MAG: hypothetical protein K5847_07200, partial [Lachnospiraceae bacterium]|nr:hypothetical protein [Lachnospiraceae bacterium]
GHAACSVREHGTLQTGEGIHTRNKNTAMTGGCIVYIDASENHAWYHNISRGRVPWKIRES